MYRSPRTAGPQPRWSCGSPCVSLASDGGAPAPLVLRLALRIARLGRRGPSPASPAARPAYRSPRTAGPQPRGSLRLALPLKSAPAAPRAGLPEIVVDAARREQPAERHLDAIPDLDVLRVDIGELALEPPAALE